VVGCTIGSRGEVPGESEPVIRDDDDDDDDFIEITLLLLLLFHHRYNFLRFTI
jgi:hypothetical protein